MTYFLPGLSLSSWIKKECLILARNSKDARDLVSVLLDRQHGGGHVAEAVRA